MSGRKGFTLVELLVVIAIIIILAAILFPVFARAREKAQQTKCINNLKQMSAAISLYEDDYGAVMPRWLGNGLSYPTWKELMDPYVKQIRKGQQSGYLETEGELYQCPSAPAEEATISWQAGRTYGYNIYLTRDTSEKDVRFPSATLRITETSQQDPDDPASGYPGGSYQLPTPTPIGFQLYAPGWHNGMDNCLWFDGHVSSIPRQRVMMTDNQADAWGFVGNVWARLSPKPPFNPDG